MRVYDSFSKRIPEREDYLVVKTHAYELFKHNTTFYANLIQRLQGNEDPISAEDLKIELMPLCGSLYISELPNIVYNPDISTDEREFVARKMNKDKKLEH